MTTRMIRLAVIGLGLIAFVGCGMSGTFKELDLGMSPGQVDEKAGEPDGKRMDGDYEVWTWTNRLISGTSWDRADYHALFLDGKLIEYGTGEVRRNSTNVLMIVPVGGG